MNELCMLHKIKLVFHSQIIYNFRSLIKSAPIMHERLKK